jgi:HAD superfamily hydrolase (TIGR01450 family)
VLEESGGPLVAGYDLVMLDLDGVVYVGPEAVPGAPEHLARARESGVHLAFVTNNASRPPERVAAHLTELGVEAATEDVVTSAQAAAHLLAGRLEKGARVFLLGGEGLRQALEAEGLTPVGSRDDDPVAVVTGYGPDVLWRDIMVGAVLVRDGLPWVASNTDLSIPTDYGVGPGHGVLVDMLRAFTGVEPDVAGKPARPLLDETVRRVGGERPLMVGDRLDTDIEGAHEAEVDSLLVLTGVTGLAELVAAGPELRPTYVASDLAGLFVQHPVPTIGDGAAELGGWQARVEDGRLEVSGAGVADDWWRVVATAAWQHLDRHGKAPDTEHLDPPETGRPDGAR